MKIINGEMNGNFLEHVSDKIFSDGQVEAVKIAMGYADGVQSIKLFDKCAALQIRLDFYGRIDHSVPINLQALDWFLKKKNPDFRCKLIPNVMHSKVIWWQGAGVYIGSANLTDNGWFRNIETGVFFDAYDLEDNGMESELEKFFGQLENFENAITLTKEIYDIQEKCLRKKQYKLDTDERKLKKEFQGLQIFSKSESIIEYDVQKANDIYNKDFRKKWYETLEILRAISARIVDYKPEWVPDSVSGGVLANRFLAMHYDAIGGGKSEVIEAHFERNKRSPESALKDRLEWFKGMQESTEQKKFMTEWAGKANFFLQQENLKKITEDEFVEMLSCIHAAIYYAGRRGESNRDEKMKAFGKILYNSSSENENSTIETLDYLIWGSGEVVERLQQCCESPDWKIPELGVNMLAEMLGWARPEEYPPRNGRIIKSLRSLGMNVKD